MIEIRKNILLERKKKKSILLDFYSNKKNNGLIIFCHGYKGFKDWGAWELVAEKFAENQFSFLKFNFSHNGGTIKDPIDFPDLESFGNNNYSKEIEDLKDVIEWSKKKLNTSYNKKKIYLIGHSRGGGIISLTASRNKNINGIVSWAGVSDYKSRFPHGKELEIWKEKGVYYVKNSRTNQQMPHYYQFYKDFIKNEAQLTIKTAIKKINIPHLIIHGTEDQVVKISEGKIQKKWNPNSRFVMVEGANHTFGSKHPWNHQKLPKNLETVLNETVVFLNKID